MLLFIFSLKSTLWSFSPVLQLTHSFPILCLCFWLVRLCIFFIEFHPVYFKQFFQCNLITLIPNSVTCTKCELGSLPSESSVKILNRTGLRLGPWRPTLDVSGLTLSCRWNCTPLYSSFIQAKAAWVAYTNPTGSSFADCKLPTEDPFPHCSCCYCIWDLCGPASSSSFCLLAPPLTPSSSKMGCGLDSGRIQEARGIFSALYYFMINSRKNFVRQTYLGTWARFCSFCSWKSPNTVGDCDAWEAEQPVLQLNPFKVATSAKARPFLPRPRVPDLEKF